MSASYKLDDFMRACRIGIGAVTVLTPAERGAREHFNLKSKPDTLQFIGNEGIHGLDFDKTRLWEKNPNPEVPVMVDSYNFFAGSDYGYLAFMFQPRTSKWLLKSFKKNDKHDPRKTVLGDALKKALEAMKKEDQ